MSGFAPETFEEVCGTLNDGQKSRHSNAQVPTQRRRVPMLSHVG